MDYPSEDHRPWPCPTAPWFMTQIWHDLLFAHWPIEPEVMRSLIPNFFRDHLDLYDGKAWIGIVPFRMTGIRARLTPSLPHLSAFPELNVRTYVTFQGKSGVLFFSLDAARWLAVQVARRFFLLPYFYAKMSLENKGGDIVYKSRRYDRNEEARFEATYAPTGPVFQAKPGSIDHWLTERYCLYTLGKAGSLYRGEIHHIPWPLRPARMTLEWDELSKSHGITLPNVPPLLHFVDRLDVAFWMFERVRL